MTKTQLKETARDHIVAAAMNALYSLDDARNIPADQREEMQTVARKELARIEKLLGYEPNSWSC